MRMPPRNMSYQSLERLPDTERYETDAYGVYGALPVNKHVAGKCDMVN